MAKLGCDGTGAKGQMSEDKEIKLLPPPQPVHPEILEWIEFCQGLLEKEFQVDVDLGSGSDYTVVS